MAKYSNVTLGQTEAALNILGGEQALVTILSDSDLASQIARVIKDLIENAAAYLALLYVGETILLSATKGSATIAGAGDLFSAYLSATFAESDMNRSSKNTKAMKVQVLEQRRNGTFMQMFTSMDANLDRLCFTQAQIIQFCRDHPDKLRQDGYGTFFLFKVGKENFVAHVLVDGSGLRALVGRLGNPRVWRAGVSQSGGRPATDRLNSWVLYFEPLSLWRFCVRGIRFILKCSLDYRLVTARRTDCAASTFRILLVTVGTSVV